MIQWQYVPDNVSLKALTCMRELDDRGLKFLVHFGCQNAEAILERLNIAFWRGTLYEQMSAIVGTTNNNYRAWPDHEAARFKGRSGGSR